MKIYRCGWCGHPTNEDGVPLEKEKFFEAVNYIEKHGDEDTTQVEGLCCAYQEEQEHYETITRDMAMDAGCPEMEGSLWKWS